MKLGRSVGGVIFVVDHDVACGGGRASGEASDGIEAGEGLRSHVPEGDRVLGSIVRA